MNAAGHAQKTKIRKDPFAAKTPAMKACATCEMKEPAPMEAFDAMFAKLTKGAPTKRELMLRSACEEQIDEMNKLLILQFQRMVRRYESLFQ